MGEWRGWLISVNSKQPSGGQPVSKLYAARIANPDAAMSAVRKYAKITDEHMQIWLRHQCPN